MHQNFDEAWFTPPQGSDDDPRGMFPVHRLWLCVIAVLCPIVGTGCPRVIEQYTVSSVPQLPESPSLADIAMVVNQNAAHVQSLYASEVKIKGSRLPTVSAKLAYVARRRFRLVAETALSGVEVDLGSNDELFWFWAKRGDPPALFFCRHDRYQTSAASQLMPIDPQWVIDSMGLTTLDLRMQHNGPVALGDGRFSIETLLRRPSGTWTRTIIVDSKLGAVVEQHLRDPLGRLVTSSVTSEHHRDVLNEVTLPGRIELSWPDADFTLAIDVSDWEVNYPVERPAELWRMPREITDQVIDLADQHFSTPPAPTKNR